MGFIDEFTSEVKDIIQNGEKKVNDVISGQKLKLDINSVNNRIEEAYCRIGKSVWEQRENPLFSCYEEEFKKLDELHKILNDYADRLAYTKGHKRCSDCGCFNPSESKFCSQCGKNI